MYVQIKCIVIQKNKDISHPKLGYEINILIEDSVTIKTKSCGDSAAA